MSQEPQFPSESERKSFLAKLGQFRESLPQSEQRMLDAMATVAFTPQEQGDVQGYGWVPAPYGAVYVGPQFYQTGFAYEWRATPFGPAWQAVPVGVYR